MTVGGTIGNSLGYSKGEVWHATDRKGAASILGNGAYGGKEGITYVFNPDEVVNGVRLGDMNAEQLQQALAIDHKIDTIVHMPRNTVALQPAPNGAYTGGYASQAILYGAGGKNVGPYGSWYTTPISRGPTVCVGPLMDGITGEMLTDGWLCNGNDCY
jgi:hypothetical protein